MRDLVVCLTSHNELTRRGEAVLRRSLASLDRALAYAARQRPGLDAYVACCDDASADATPDYVARYFAGKDWFRLVRNRVGHGPGFGRNVAAAQFDAGLVCLLDADDEYKEEHLAVCVAALETARDPHGKPFLAASTTAELSVPVHPDWVPIISGTLPLTKAVRREAWEFVEGMPAEAVYRPVAGEDWALTRRLATFANLLGVANVTVRYWNYPGSFFDRQLPKFTKPRSQYDPARDEPAKPPGVEALRVQTEEHFLAYLGQKFTCLGWKERLEGYSLAPPYAAG